MTDYIPEPDAAAQSWMQNLSNHLLAEGDAYHVTPAAAAAVAAAVTAFAHARAVALDPDTRTRGAIAAKRQARAAAEVLCRRVAQQIRLDDTLSDAQKINVGVRPIKTKRVHKIEVPDEVPRLSVDFTGLGQHRISIRKAANDDVHGRRMPAGAVAVQIFRNISEAGPGTISPADTCSYYATFTRTSFRISDYTFGDAGKVATYVARWISRRGEEGPFGAPVARRIVA